MARRPRVVVRIDELVAHDLDRQTAVRLADALETELSRVLAAEGLPRAGVNADRLVLPDVGSPVAADPARLGAEVARSLHGAIAQSQGTSVRPAGRDRP